MISELVELVESERAKRGLSLRAVSMYMDVPRATLHALVSGKSVPDPTTCIKIARWLKLPPARILGMAGHEEMADLVGEPMPPISDEAAEIAFKYDDLRDPAHRALIRQQLLFLRESERSWEFREDDQDQKS